MVWRPLSVSSPRVLHEEKEITAVSEIACLVV